MYDPYRVGCSKGFCNFDCVLPCFIDRQVFTGQDRRERGSYHVLHDDEVDVFCCLKIVNADNSAMVQRRGGASFL
jgi:hypothetical protein